MTAAIEGNRVCEIVNAIIHDKLLAGVSSVEIASRSSGVAAR